MGMQDAKSLLRKSAPVLAFLFFCGACAVLQAPLEVPKSSETRQSIAVTADSFAFRPNNLVATAGSTLILEVENASTATHNLTVETPDGEVLTSVDLPGERAVRIEVPLKSRGMYTFYCDKFMHATLGMRGRIDAR